MKTLTALLMLVVCTTPACAFAGSKEDRRAYVFARPHVDGEQLQELPSRPDSTVTLEDIHQAVTSEMSSE